MKHVHRQGTSGAITRDVGRWLLANLSVDTQKRVVHWKTWDELVVAVRRKGYRG